MKVMIGFDERINLATVNGTTFSLVLQGQGTIPSTMTVSREEEMGRCSKD
jgi:hypothetical protein